MRSRDDPTGGGMTESTPPRDKKRRVESSSSSRGTSSGIRKEASSLPSDGACDKNSVLQGRDE